MDMKFLRSIQRKTRRDRIRNEIFREVGIQNLLIELEKKQQQFGHLKRMDRTRIPRTSLEIN
jgi:hypothetical protein